MKTAQDLLKKIEDLNFSIKYTKRTIDLIESALRNPRNHRVVIKSDIDGDSLYMDIEAIKHLLGQQLDTLKRNLSFLLELEKELMEFNKFERLLSFDFKKINKDCLCSWATERFDNQQIEK